MAVVYLGRDDAVTVYGPGTVYGGTGRERVLIADGARDVTLSPTVEEMHLSLNAGDYQFRGASGRVEV